MNLTDISGAHGVTWQVLARIDAEAPNQLLAGFSLKQHVVFCRSPKSSMKGNKTMRLDVSFAQVQKSLKSFEGNEHKNGNEWNEWKYIHPRCRCFLLFFFFFSSLLALTSTLAGRVSELHGTHPPLMNVPKRLWST